ncbi:hypothetical protein ACSVBT_16500 [Afipia sp. TerB]
MTDLARGVNDPHRCAARASPFDNGPAVMVTDAKLERGLDGVAAQALTRAEVIGTPIADNLFAIYDAIILQDPRVTALVMEDDDEDIVED